MVEDQELKRITNRHIARLLTKLDEIRIPDIAKTVIKSEIWELTEDLTEAVKSGTARV